MNDLDSMKRFLENTHRSISSKVKIITPDQLDAPCYLHISVNPSIRKFIPFVSRRTMEDENITLPRISVSTTIIGCIHGYASAFYDFIDLSTVNDSDNKDNHNRSYKGGYYIYAFEPVISLKPTRQLVDDVLFTDEHWLVAFDKDHLEYKASVVGKLFIYEMILQPHTGKIIRNNIRGDAEFYIETNREINLGYKYTLKPGYYRIKGPLFNERDYNYKHAKIYDVKMISKSEYMDVKNKNVAMLSYEEQCKSKQPIYTRW